MNTFRNSTATPPPLDASLAPREMWNVTRVSAFMQQAGVPASVPTIYRKVAAGAFPQPLRFGEKCTRWDADEVRSWMATAGRITE